MNIKELLFAMSITLLTACGTTTTEHLHHETTENHEHTEHAHNHEAHNHKHEGCNHEHNNTLNEEHQHSHKTANQTKHSHEHEGHSDEIEFSTEKAKHFGVETSIVKKGSFYEIIKVSGQILPAQSDESVISAKSSGIIRLNSNAIEGKQLAAGSSIGHISSKNVAGGDANEAARINYEAAKRELDRITPLYNDRIITEREYNQAKQVFEQAKAALTSNSDAGSSATSNIAGTITKINIKDGEFVAVGTPLAIVSKNAKLILRADLPNRYAPIVTSIKTANFKPAYTETVYDLTQMNGNIVSNKNLSVVTPGYIPINFEFSNTTGIVPGTFAEIYLIGTSKNDCITLPLDAITEEEGYFFVYKKVHEESYMKNEVKIGLNNGEHVEILSGVHEGDQIVTKGAILMKLASKAGSVPGHSHEH